MPPITLVPLWMQRSLSCASGAFLGTALHGFGGYRVGSGVYGLVFRV